MMMRYGIRRHGRSVGMGEHDSLTLYERQYGYGEGLRQGAAPVRFIYGFDASPQKDFMPQRHAKGSNNVVQSYKAQVFLHTILTTLAPLRLRFPLPRPSQTSPLSQLTHLRLNLLANHRPSSKIGLLGPPLSSTPVSSVVSALNIQNIAITKAATDIGRASRGERNIVVRRRGIERRVVLV